MLQINVAILPEHATTVPMLDKAITTTVDTQEEVRKRKSGVGTMPGRVANGRTNLYLLAHGWKMAN